MSVSCIGFSWKQDQAACKLSLVTDIDGARYHNQGWVFLLLATVVAYEGMTMYTVFHARGLAARSRLMFLAGTLAVLLSA